MATTTIVRTHQASPFARLCLFDRLLLASTTTPSRTRSLSSQASSVLLGGDYCSQSASVNAKNGTLIPLPQRYIPQELIDWGQAPSYWECIVSEEMNKDKLHRHELKILPDVGCGVDNLQTLKTSETLEVVSVIVQEDGGNDDDDMHDFAFDTPSTEDDDGIIRTETCFNLGGGHRLRVVLNVGLFDDCYVIVPNDPIVLSMERKISDTSSDGTMADGGGLSASRIFEMVGEHLSKSPGFSDQPAASVEHQQNNQEEGVLMNLPGNVSIITSSSSSSPWTLDIVYSEVKSDGETEKHSIRRSYPYSCATVED